MRGLACGRASPGGFQHFCQGDVPCVVAGEVAAQRPYSFSKRREGKQLYIQPHQVSMRAGGLNTRYLPAPLEPAQDVAGFDKIQLRTGQLIFGKCSFRPPAFLPLVDKRGHQHGCVDDRGHDRSASRARRIRFASTRVSATVLRPRTPCSHASRDGREAIRSSSARKNFCMDWRWRAARTASSSRTSSGTFLIVICTGMTALCHHHGHSVTAIQLGDGSCLRPYRRQRASGISGCVRLLAAPHYSRRHGALRAEAKRRGMISGTGARGEPSSAANANR